jgi:hypothetical protein
LFTRRECLDQQNGAVSAIVYGRPRPVPLDMSKYMLYEQAFSATFNLMVNYDCLSEPDDADPEFCWAPAAIQQNKASMSDISCVDKYPYLDPGSDGYCYKPAQPGYTCDNDKCLANCPSGWSKQVVAGVPWCKNSQYIINKECNDAAYPNNLLGKCYAASVTANMLDSDGFVWKPTECPSGYQYNFLWFTSSCFSKANTGKKRVPFTCKSGYTNDENRCVSTAAAGGYTTGCVRNYFFICQKCPSGLIMFCCALYFDVCILLTCRLRI